jgi:SAM-dependent methyltransferase
MTGVTWTESFLDVVLGFIPTNVKSVLDVGCGRGIVGAIVKIYRSPIRIVGLDIFDPYLDFCRSLNIYSEIMKYDLRNTPLPFNDNEFDVAVALEVIEHLPKSYGYKLLSELERVGRRVIISTPKYFQRQPCYDGNPFQQHVSRWYSRDFRQLGYTVRGVGLMLIAGHSIKYLSYALSRCTFLLPSLSSSILAIKS